MSTHVTDLEGRSWEVSREWFGLPGWSRRESSVGDALDTASWLPGDVGVSMADDLAVAILGLAITIVAIVVFAVAVWLVLPLVFLFVGLVVALVGVGARLLSLAAWTVTARARERQSGGCVGSGAAPAPCATWPPRSHEVRRRRWTGSPATRGRSRRRSLQSRTGASMCYRHGIVG